MVSVPRRQLAFPGNAARAPAGCEAGTSPRKSGTATKTAPDTAASPGRTGRNAGADVQAPEVFPEVFNLPAQGLWDGRPSPGGVWIASADARDPDRVIIRNDATGETVIGALFRRERENPGPPIRISPDAAKAPGLLAGQPARATITALRRSEDTPAAAAPATAAAAPATSSPAAGGKSYSQPGIFSVEANARPAADTVTRAGASAALRKEASKGKPCWSGGAGPAASAANRDALMKKIKGLGSADACFVSR
jgi:hypothetical protein